MTQYHSLEYVQTSFFNEDHCCALLHWPEKNRYVPIWIGTADAVNLLIREAGEVPRRPRALDLLLDVLSQLDTRLTELRISYYFDGIFVAQLVTENGEEFDCRPSDGLMLAGLTSLPISVSQNVLAQTAIFISPCDLDEWLGIEIDDASMSEAPAVENTQADLDFSELMRSMGVKEEDLSVGLPDSEFNISDTGGTDVTEDDNDEI
ncbi:bifunctional nuclease family protein [Corynebacterium sp. ES2715-CONJ3]|uniref:bifunctional nuclease family protein n=1 Tax=Corynebacterium sp. ES2715-CONJ3 TaxID=2974028 RepID=UPI00216A189F|nr:bifunctional nuclease family protein [Corynebacterium sp. ES2715-CONJ3]MCS4491190.1 bifunctional nuclease family protein [Corynebacterium sp. ES2715-CONJ3]